jgi:hypothetical protein
LKARCGMSISPIVRKISTRYAIYWIWVNHQGTYSFCLIKYQHRQIYGSSRKHLFLPVGSERAGMTAQVVKIKRSKVAPSLH